MKKRVISALLVAAMALTCFLQALFGQSCKTFLDIIDGVKFFL